MSEKTETLVEVVKLLDAEIKRYRHQDIILSERETAENEKIAKILGDISKKILELN